MEIDERGEEVKGFWTRMHRVDELTNWKLRKGWGCLRENDEKEKKCLRTNNWEMSIQV